MHYLWSGEFIGKAMVNDFITNEQRRYLCLDPIGADWEVVAYRNRRLDWEVNYLQYGLIYKETTCRENPCNDELRHRVFTFFGLDAAKSYAECLS